MTLAFKHPVSNHPNIAFRAKKKTSALLWGEKMCWIWNSAYPQTFLVNSTSKTYWYIVLGGGRKHTVSMFEGNPPPPRYLKKLINNVVFYPVKSAALMPWQIYSVSLAGRRKTRLPAVVCCLWLWWIMCLERDRKTERELEGIKSLFALLGNKTEIVCRVEYVSQEASTAVALLVLFQVCRLKYAQLLPLNTSMFNVQLAPFLICSSNAALWRNCLLFTHLHVISTFLKLC